MQDQTQGKVKFNTGLSEIELYVKCKNELFIARRYGSMQDIYDCLKNVYSCISNCMNETETAECLNFIHKCGQQVRNQRKLDQSNDRGLVLIDYLWPFEIRLNQIAKRVGYSNPEIHDDKRR